MKKKWSIIPLSATALLSTGMLFNASAQAAYMNDIDYMGAVCTPDSVSIKNITKTVGGDSVYSGDIQATGCVGMLVGENDDSLGGIAKAPNTGILYNGFMNGAVTSGNANTKPQTEAELADESINTGQLDPLTFITESDLQDIKDEGVFVDPGWIHLAHFNNEKTDTDGKGFAEYSSIGEGGGALNLGDVLNIAFDCDKTIGCTQGTWTVSALANSIEDVSAILGENTFDHLAFVFKSGNSNGVGVYDFDFKKLVYDAGLDVPGPLAGTGFGFDTPYTFSGEWNMGDFLNEPKNGKTPSAQEYSHINIWARDPANTPTNDVPEPATIALFGLGLLGLAGMRKRKMA